MSPRSILTLIATFFAGVTLCLAGYEVAARFNQETRSVYGILFAVSAVLTSVICIAVLDWARNLESRMPRHRRATDDGADALPTSDDYMPGSAGNDELLAAVHRLQGMANEELSVEKAIQEALDLIGEFAAAESVSLWSLDEDGSLTPMGERANRRTLVGAEAVTETLDETVAGELTRHRKAMEMVGELTNTFLIPLCDGTRCTGILKVVVESHGSSEQRNDEAQRVLADLITLGRQLVRTVAAPDDYQRAVTDSVTGLYSRRHLVNRLTECATVSRRYGESLSLLLLEIDNLRTCNRTHGEATGDRVLGNVAATVQEAVREADSAYRYGEGTIAVVLPATEGEQAVKVAERLRQGIRNGRSLCEDGGTIISTVSVGVAEFDEDMRGIAPLIGGAESALAAAKAKGGDRVEAGEDPQGAEQA
jgi:diguanylate cyclase (GGDEF)-like protein